MPSDPGQSGPPRFSNDYILLEEFNNQKLGNKDNHCNSIFA